MLVPAGRKGQRVLVGNTRKTLKHTTCFAVFIIAGCMLTFSAKAASFVIVDGQVVTTGQTLTDDETGVIQSGGQLNTVGWGIIVPGEEASKHSKWGGVSALFLAHYYLYAAHIFIRGIFYFGGPVPISSRHRLFSIRSADLRVIIRCL